MFILPKHPTQLTIRKPSATRGPPRIEAPDEGLDKPPPFNRAKLAKIEPNGSEATARRRGAHSATSQIHSTSMAVTPSPTSHYDTGCWQHPFSAVAIWY